MLLEFHPRIFLVEAELTVTLGSLTVTPEILAFVAVTFVLISKSRALNVPDVAKVAAEG